MDSGTVLYHISVLFLSSLSAFVRTRQCINRIDLYVTRILKSFTRKRLDKESKRKQKRRSDNRISKQRRDMEWKKRTKMATENKALNMTISRSAKKVVTAAVALCFSLKPFTDSIRPVIIFFFLSSNLLLNCKTYYTSHFNSTIISHERPNSQ